MRWPTDCYEWAISSSGRSAAPSSASSFSFSISPPHRRQTCPSHIPAPARAPTLSRQKSFERRTQLNILIMSDRRNKGEVVYSEALKGVEVEEDKFALANRMIEETAKQIKKTEGKMNEIEVFLEQAEDGREAHPEL